MSEKASFIIVAAVETNNEELIKSGSAAMNGYVERLLSSSPHITRVAMFLNDDQGGRAMGFQNGYGAFSVLQEEISGS